MGVLEEALASAAAYVPVNITPDQLRRESGGRQMGSNGKTLVGRYPNGSMPKASERSYGAAQMQIGTAKETAAAHGIAWDENAFMNDRNYNLRLGDLHKGDLKKKYGGDETKALGAYHSGVGNVDAAIARASREGGDWRRFLGPEGRKYTGFTVGGSSGGGTAVAGLTIPDILRDKGATEGSGPTTSQIWNPNEAAGTIARDADTTRDRAVTADNVLTQAIGALGARQAEETGALAARNERMNGVLEDVAQTTQEVLNRNAPLFQQKQALHDQRAKMRATNPLVRAFKGLFDANWNEDDLNQTERELDSDIQLNNQQYDENMKAQDTFLKLIDQSYNGLSMEHQLESQHDAQKIQMASQSLGAAQQLWSIDTQTLSADASLRSQQQELANQVMSELTPGQIETYYNQSKQSPDGTVTVNGAKLSQGMLLGMAQRQGEQQLRLDQMALAAQAQNQALKDRAEEDLIGSMTTGQIRQAIKGGGMFNGQQLSLDKLGAGLQRSMQTDASMAAGTMAEGGGQMLGNMIDSLANVTGVGIKRGQQLTGGSSPEWGAFATRVRQGTAEMTAKLRAATPAEKPILAQQYMQTVQGWGQEAAKINEGIAERWAGGNKALKPLAVAYMNGTPLNGESSAAALIELVKGGGTLSHMGPEAQAAFAAAKGVVSRWNAKLQGAGQSVATLNTTTVKGKEMQNQMIQEVVAAVGRTYNNNQYDSALKAAPQVARQIGHLGQNLNPGLVREAISYGDAEGVRRMATQLGVSEEQMRAIVGPNGSTSAEWTKVSTKDGPSYTEVKARVNMMQNMAMLQWLDQHHPKIGGHKAGAVYADLVSSPRFAQFIGNAAAAQGQGGFGDFVVGSIGNGQLIGQASMSGQATRNAYTQLGRDQRAIIAKKANEYGDPMRRTATILGAIDGLEPVDERALLRAVAPVYQAANHQRPSGGAALAHAADFTGSLTEDAGFDAIRNWIVNGKAENPVLEKARQKAAAKFDEMSRITDRAFDRFGSYSPGAQ